MLIGGLQKFSMIDYPGKTCAIIFTVGCNFRCHYCHNPELINGKGCNFIDAQEVLDFLKTRVGKLEAVTITGGEPTLHKDLLEFIKKIKEMGFLVKLDSNGTNPEFLEEIFNANVVDYVAMDIKAPEEKYAEIIGATVDFRKIKKSIKLIMDKALDYEFRTTIVVSQLSPEDFEKIGEMIRGAKKYYLQKFIPSKTINKDFMNEKTYTDEEFEELKKTMFKYVDFCDVR